MAAVDGKKNEQPLWKAYEDKKLQEERDKEEKLALFFLKEWLEKHKIPFIENTKGNLININSGQLISRREIIKLLTLTKGYLGIQFYQGEIGIYKLHSKIEK